MEVTLLGTGDTTGTPTVGCDCDTCEAARERGIERSRFSIHVRNEETGETLLVDASPDFRQQFLREGLNPPDAAVITHAHFDHLHGLGNAYRLTRDLPVYAPHDAEESVANEVRDTFDYLDALDVREVTPFESFEAAGFEVTVVPVDHLPLPCYGLAIEGPSGEKLSISGDTSYGLPPESRDALRDPDLLIADGIVHADFCEYHPAGGSHPDDDGVPRTFGTKHMTFTGARALAEDLHADRYRIVHVSHYPPAEIAFGDDLAVDGEQFSL